MKQNGYTDSNIEAKRTPTPFDPKRKRTTKPNPISSSPLSAIQYKDMKSLIIGLTRLVITILSVSYRPA